MLEKNIEEDNQQLIKQLQEQMKAEQQLNQMLSMLLDSNAKARLSNIKLANKNLYLKAVQTIISLYNMGHLKGRMSDDDLKALLEKLSAKREIKIKRR